MWKQVSNKLNYQYKLLVSHLGWTLNCQIPKLFLVRLAHMRRILDSLLFKHIHPSLVHIREMAVVVDNVYMVNPKNKLWPVSFSSTWGWEGLLNFQSWSYCEDHRAMNYSYRCILHIKKPTHSLFIWSVFTTYYVSYIQMSSKGLQHIITCLPNM